MPIVARAATPCLGFDTATKLTSTQAIRLHEAGYQWCARYVRLPGNSAEHDIDASELEYLIKIGFQVSLVQHVREPPWNPSDHSALADAMAAVEHAREARYPEGAHLFVDAEGIALGLALAGDCVEYYVRWASQVCAEGYQAGMYVGYDVPMSAEDLWLLHGVNSYWRDPGPRHVATRSFAIRQRAPELVVAGVRIDEDELSADLLGDTPVVAVWHE